jgi:hypothetical protein
MNQTYIVQQNMQSPSINIEVADAIVDQVESPTKKELLKIKLNMIRKRTKVLLKKHNWKKFLQMEQQNLDFSDVTIQAVDNSNNKNDEHHCDESYLCRKDASNENVIKNSFKLPLQPLNSFHVNNAVNHHDEIMEEQSFGFADKIDNSLFADNNPSPMHKNTKSKFHFIYF